MAEEISPLENHGWWMEQLRKDAKAQQPEALRLADALSAAIKQVDADDDVIHVARWFVKDTAAELRRLHEQNQRFYAQHASVVSDYEKAVVALKAQRDALLEALHAMLSHTAMLDPSQGFDGFDHSAVNQARAAIKAVEEGK